MLQEFGNTIYVAFMMPGDLVLSTIGIAGDDRSVVMLVITSLVAWSLIAVAGLLLLKLLQDAARNVGARIRTLAYRISRAAARLKTKVTLKFRGFLPQRARRSADAAPMVEFDDLDLAVLRSAASRGPGFTTSAPELADQLTLRPKQVQRSLDKLNKNKMLEYVIGSTDGFDNYRLSQLGTAFMARWQQAGQ